MKQLIFIMILWASLGLSVVAQSRSHTMKPGETLYSLARQYGVSLTALLEANNIVDVASIPSGMILVIPTAGSVPLNVNNSSTPVASIYYAKQGDTYYSIARRHGMKVDELLRLSNRSANDSLQIGDQLMVTGSPQASTVEPQISAVITTEEPKRIIDETAIINEDNRLKEAPPRQVALPSTDSAIAPPRARPSELAVIDGVTWPVNGIISDHDGRQRGVRIAIKGEQSIKALSRGTVVYKGSYRELGQIVVVEHAGGYTYLYSGFDNAYVKIGDTVEAGTSLGKVSVNNNIIFSVFKDGNPINPKIAPRD